MGIGPRFHQKAEKKLDMQEEQRERTRLTVCALLAVYLVEEEGELEDRQRTQPLKDGCHHFLESTIFFCCFQV
uniref:Uncharacterized protein n=1 Tax=Sphaerodactylus townsendi TaxID=933632 RepID=A0ACB8EKE0_9SAUR